MNQLHQSRWDTLTDVAKRCVVDKQFDKAEEAYLAALREAEQFGEADPRIAQTLNALARVYHRRSKFFPAAALLHRLLGIKERELGDQHPELAGILSNLAEMYSRLGDHRQELELRERALLLRSAEGEQAAGALSGLQARIEELKRTIAEEEERQAAAREEAETLALEKASRRVHVPTGASGLPLILPTPIASATVPRTGGLPTGKTRTATPQQPQAQNQRLASRPFPDIRGNSPPSFPGARTSTPTAPGHVTPAAPRTITPPAPGLFSPPAPRELTPTMPAAAARASGRIFDRSPSPQSVPAAPIASEGAFASVAAPVARPDTPAAPQPSASPAFSEVVSAVRGSDPMGSAEAPALVKAPAARQFSPLRSFPELPAAPGPLVQPLGSEITPAIEPRRSPAWSASPAPYEEPDSDPELYEQPYPIGLQRNWRPFAIGGGALLAAAVAAVLLFGGGDSGTVAKDDPSAQPAAAQSGSYAGGISEQEALDVGLANLREHAPAPGVDMSAPDQDAGPASEVARRTAEGRLADTGTGNDSAEQPAQADRLTIQIPKVSLDKISDNIDAAARARVDSATAAHDRKVSEYKGNNNDKRDKLR